MCSNFLISFVEHSMVFNELNQEIATHKSILTEKKYVYQKKKEQIVFLKTLPAICSRYTTIELAIPTTKNKKRRQLEKERDQIIIENPTCKNDCKIFSEIEEFEIIMREQEEEIFYLENYISERVFAVCDVLKDKQFIQEMDNNYELTELGKISADIAEVHPLIMTQLITHTNWFAEQNVEEIIGILSIFKIPNFKWLIASFIQILNC